MLVSGRVKKLSRLGTFCFLGGGFNFLYFHPYLGKISNLTNIFQMGWFNHQQEMKTPYDIGGAMMMVARDDVFSH